MRRFISVPCLLIAVGFTSACGVLGFSSDDGSGNGGTVSSPPCDPGATPKIASCVVDDQYGVFVSGKALADGADGSKAHPLATIQAGIEQAKTAKKNVYVCKGTYAEQVKIEDGVSMFGYFDCDQNWAVSPTDHAAVAAASPAMTADQINSPTRVEAIDFTSSDAAANQTSFGALITSSSGLTLANLTITGGAGGKGDDGSPATALTQANPNGSNGFAGDTTCTKATMVTAENCAETPVAGGDGTCSGAAGYAGGTGGAGGTGEGIASNGGTQVHPAATGGATPATAMTALGGSNALHGAPGQAGAAGADGTNGTNAATVGELASTGYTPVDGTSGSDGQGGQGGGGGGGNSQDPMFATQPGRFAGGAGGGAGGCPGLAGGAGKGGGASVGAVIIESPVTFDTCILQSSSGGRAGAGDLGSAPTGGGDPGSTSASTQSQTFGGHGGAGGASGWSGNGFPGPSYAVAIHGAAPTFTSCVTTPGPGGPGLDAKTSGNKTIPATAAGPSEATHSF